MFSNGSFISYYGILRSTTVFVKLSDSTAFIEYSHTGYHMRLYNLKFDTLKFNKNKYSGKFSTIQVLGENVIFNPGNITLKQGEPDSSLNKRRNLGYLQNIDADYKKALKWTGLKLDDFELKKWSQKNDINLPVEVFRFIIVNSRDSINRYYTSAYCQKFNEVIIKDCRILPKKYLESADTSRIHKMWHLLSTGVPKQKSNIPYLVQIPIPFICLAIFGVNPIILAAIIVHPITCWALLNSEKFVANRLTARSTYKIIFISNGTHKNCIKVRNSKIITSDYNYSLPFNFVKNELRVIDD